MLGRYRGSCTQLSAITVMAGLACAAGTEQASALFNAQEAQGRF